MTEPDDTGCAICGAKPAEEYPFANSTSGLRRLCGAHSGIPHWQAAVKVEVLNGDAADRAWNEIGAAMDGAPEVTAPGLKFESGTHKLACRPPTFIVEIDSGIDEWVRVLSPDEPLDGFEDESKAWALARKLHGTVQVRVRDIDHEPSMHPVDAIIETARDLGLELDPEILADLRARVDAVVGWSSIVPKEDGWYWMRDSEQVPELVEIDGRYLYRSGSDVSEYKDALPFPALFWSEPIAEPPA